MDPKDALTESSDSDRCICLCNDCCVMGSHTLRDHIISGVFHETD